MKVTKNFVQGNFNSTMLKIGEMMELAEDYPGSIILRIYNRFISLDDPSISWGLNTELEGRKLLSGESITLTQE